MNAMGNEIVLPYVWPGTLSNRKSFGPYDVTYSENGVNYHGEFRTTVTWEGLQTIEVKLKRGALEQKYKGTGRWF